MTRAQFSQRFILPSIRLSPKGHSLITEQNFQLHRVPRAIIASLRVLIGERISQVQGFGLTRQERLQYYSSEDYNERRHPVSIVKSDQWQKQVLRRGWKFSHLISCLTALSAFVLGKAVLSLAPLAWLWLGYELAKIEIWERKLEQTPHLESFGKVIGKLMIVTAISFGLSILFIVLFYPITLGLSVWMLPFLLTGAFGAYAFMVRLLRVASRGFSLTQPDQNSITCQRCQSPMRQLKATELRQHLTPPQHTEVTLKSKFHEGWQCQHCLPPYHPQDLNIHLSSYVLNKKGYEECPTCQTLTVEVTRYPLQKTTKRKPGKRTENRYCHYCKARSTHEVIIPSFSQGFTDHNHSGATSGDCNSSRYSKL